MHEEMFYETLYIPSHKPPLLKIVKNDILPEVSQYQAITTPKGRSYGGDTLTGILLPTLIHLQAKIIYITSAKDQTLHTVHYSFFKNIPLSLEESYEGKSTLSFVQSGRITLTPSIDLIHTKVKTSNSFDLSALIKLHFKPY